MNSENTYYAYPGTYARGRLLRSAKRYLKSIGDQRVGCLAIDLVLVTVEIFQLDKNEQILDWGPDWKSYHWYAGICQVCRPFAPTSPFLKFGRSCAHHLGSSERSRNRCHQSLGEHQHGHERIRAEWTCPLNSNYPLWSPRAKSGGESLFEWLAGLQE